MQRFDQFEDESGFWGMVYEDDVPLIGSHAWRSQDLTPRMSIMWWGRLAPTNILRFCIDAMLASPLLGDRTFARSFDGNVVKTYRDDWLGALAERDLRLFNVGFGVDDPREMMDASLLVWGSMPQNGQVEAPMLEALDDDVDDDEGEGRDWPPPENLGVYTPLVSFVALATPLERYVCATHVSKPSRESAREAITTLLRATSGLAVELGS